MYELLSPMWLILLLLRLILLLPLLLRGLLLLMPRLILLLLLIRWATFTVAFAASAAIVASTSPTPSALTAASGYETSGQGMAAVGLVQAPVELFHTDEGTF